MTVVYHGTPEEEMERFLKREVVPIKAEILFTRACNLSCDYCSIIYPYHKRMTELSPALWVAGLEQLKKVGVSFLAIYGGEPTLRFDELCAFIKKADELGFQQSLLTNCHGMTQERWTALADAGLDSVTVSLDMMQGLGEADRDPDILKRAVSTWVALKLLREVELFPDIQVTMTVTRDNLHHVLPIQAWCQERGCWFHADIEHPSRGQPGSKCRGRGHYFTEEFLEETVVPVFTELLTRKTRGDRIHLSEHAIDCWLDSEYPVYLNWKCRAPFWLTVDADGAMMPCDDHTSPWLARFNVTKISDEWGAFVEAWFHWRRNTGCRCFWSTHMMAEEQALSSTGPSEISHGRV